MRCPLIKINEQGESWRGWNSLPLWLSWCSDPAAQAVTAPGGSSFPSAEDRDRIHIYCPKQPQRLFPARECQPCTVRGCLEIPKEPQETQQSLSTGQLFCRSLVLVLFLLQLLTSACLVEVQTCGVSGGLGYILRIYFHWNFQTSSGWVSLKIYTSGTAKLCVLQAVQLMALPLCRVCFRCSALWWRCFKLCHLQPFLPLNTSKIMDNASD